MTRLTHSRLGVGISLLAIAALVLVGCGGDFAPTLPSPEGAVPPGPEPEPEPDTTLDIYGQVTDLDGDPLAGVRVDTADGTDTWTDTTDADGNYRLADVSAGSRGVTFALPGYATEYAIAVVEDVDVELNMVMASRVEGSPTECPVITLNDPVVDQEAGLATISGTVTNTDADQAVVIHNGDASLIAVQSGAFSNIVVLLQGENVIHIMVANAACTTISEPITINYQPGVEGQFYCRVTLTWNTPTSDMDTHVWAPSGQHCLFYNRQIDAGELDLDDVDGFGPENFTLRTLEAGRFRVGINNYSLHEDGPTDCVVRVVTGALAANGVNQVLGPYTLSVDNRNQSYPVTGNTASWWRPCDIVLGSDGSVQVVDADNEPLQEGTGMSAAAAKGPFLK